MGGAPSLADTEFMEKWNAILFERINGDSKLTDTENVTFFVSYGILTESLRMNVILTYFRNGARRYGYGRTET